MAGTAAVGAIAAAADGLLDEDRTDREEHDSRYDQYQNDITNTPVSYTHLPKTIVVIN